jgi:23S rRNA pseudouridine1911/1915/1917 synthase
MANSANNTPEPLQLTALIPDDFAGLRMDQAVARLFPDYSRAKLQSWIKNGQLSVKSVSVKALRPRDKVHGGETVILNIETPIAIPSRWEPQAAPLDIVYEDDAVLIINKPIGLVVHPAAGNWSGTLVNALLYYRPSLEALPRAGIVHRIDKDTSGLLVVAKTLPAHTALVRQLQSHTVQREYLAVARGEFTAGGTVDAPMARNPIHRKRMAVIHNGKRAVTHYRVLERFHGYTLLSIHLETGRTHQIRVHMAHIHHPLVGDATYGGRLQIPAGISPELTSYLRHFKRQALHATRLGFIHPVTKEPVEWQVPLPDDIEALLTAMRDDTRARN